MNFLTSVQNFKNYTKLINNLFCAVLILFLLQLPDFIFSKINENYLFTFDIKDKVMIAFAVLMSFLTYTQKKILFIFFYILIMLEICYFNYFGNLIAPFDILLFFHNTFEIIDALQDLLLKLSIPILIIIVSLFISLKIIKYCDKIAVSKYNKSIFIFIISVLLIMPLIVAYQINIKHKEVPGRNPKLYTSSIKNMINVLDYFIAVTLPNSLSDKIPIKEFPKLNKISSPDVNIIFIIGESFRAKNAYLLGYNKENMPKLKQQHITIKKCISIGVMTKVSMGYMLNGASSLEEYSKIFTHDFSIFKLAKQNGFHTTFITAQPSVSFKYIKNLIDEKNIDNFKTPKYFYHSQFSSLNDAKLISLLKQINLNKQKNLIVFQMNGSHFPYSNKSPKDFKKFKSEYDNSILYTDYVLSKIIDYIKKIKKPTFFFFVSDHGELLGEYGQRGHGRLKKEVYEVPFIYYSNASNDKITDFLTKQKIIYQADIIKLIDYLLGYDVNITPNNHRKVQVIGRDLAGHVGYKIIDINNNIIKEAKTLYK